MSIIIRSVSREGLRREWEMVREKSVDSRFSVLRAGSFMLDRLFLPFHVEWLMDVNCLFFAIDSDCQLIHFQRIIEGPRRREIGCGKDEKGANREAMPAGIRGCRWGGR